MASFDSQSVTKRYQRAVAHYQARNYAGCRFEADQLLAEEPRNDAGLTLKGMALLELDEPDSAIDALRAATGIAPDNEEAWAQLGVALMTAGHLAEAAEAFREALRLNGENLSAMVDLGNLLFMLGQRDDAVDMLAAASRLRPDDVAVLRNTASMYVSSGLAEPALGVFRRILQLQPNDVPAQCDAAWLLLEQDRLDEAAVMFRGLRQSDPEHELYAIHGLAIVEIRREDWRRALSLAIEATRLDRYDFTTSLLSFISSKVFDQDTEATGEELFRQFESEHQEHRRLHAEAPAA